jgi:hypothetical protein
MGLLLAIVVVLVLALGTAAILLLRRRRPVPLPVPEAPPKVDPAAEAARHKAIDERGSALLERRVDLDARRGTLTGDSAVYDAFDRLEAQFRAGQISEDEFEARKILILGG